jgi:Pectate lyase superfamily protein
MKRQIRLLVTLALMASSAAFALKAEHCLCTIAGDGGGGNFYWDAAASELDNGGTVLLPDSNPATGRWKRLVKGNLSVKWFGAKGNGMCNDSKAIQATVNAGDIFFPPGTYLVDAITYLPSNRLIEGAGAASVLKRIDPRSVIVFFWLEGVSDVTIRRPGL